MMSERGEKRGKRMRRREDESDDDNITQYTVRLIELTKFMITV